MDDGSKKGNTCVLHTNNYTFEDAYRLAAILHYNFNIESTVRSTDINQPLLYIKQKNHLINLRI
jgi:competence transcription factor ComK